MFENLKVSEIKKAERFANKNTGKKDCKVTAWYTISKDDKFGFYQIGCEICSNNMTDREDDVIIEVFMKDRRMSFCHY